MATAYLTAPLAYWGPDAPRHADKLERRKQAIRDRDGLGDQAIVSEVLRMAARRRAQRPAPVFVAGLGGSGSHWLAGMLEDATDLVAAGEVYLPRALLDELDGLSDADQACVIDAVHLMHGWPRSAGAWALGLINNAAGVGMLPRYLRWFPDATVVHLRRDPRDQVLSVTFRKPEFRRYVAASASDDQYLQRMIRRNAAAYRAYLAARELVDVTCRYEDLLDDPRPALHAVLAALRHDIDEQRVELAIERHDADAIRAGRSTVTSNLHGGGAAPSWRDLRDRARQRVLHAGLADVIHGFGYPPGDCMGSHLPDGDLPDRSLAFPAGQPGLLYERRDGTWRRWDTDRSRVHLTAGTAVLLRIGTEDADLRGLRDLAAGDVQALCLAGNTRLGDEAVAHVSGMTGLQTLDLADTAVTDGGLAQLARLRGLQQINLAGTATTARGRADLAARLPQVTIWT